MYSFFGTRSAVVLAVMALFSGAVQGRDIRADVAANLSHGASGLTITPRGEFVVAVHQAFRPVERVIKLARDGTVGPFPNASIAGQGRPAGAVKLDAVHGIECDGDGVVWMVDNGRRGEVVPKLVGWNTDKDRLFKVIYLPAPTTIKTSFLDDIAVDPKEPYVYIGDPAQGADAALVVVDLTTGLARRVLGGQPCVVPEAELELRIDSGPITARGMDGRPIQLQAGIGPLAVDRKGDWVYLGPRMGKTLYRIRAEHLQDPDLSSTELAAKVEVYSSKPICDGITLDAKGNVYVSDLAAKAIGVIDVKEKNYRIYSTDPRFLWIDGFCFGPDGHLYGYANQLHRSAFFNRGRDLSQPPFYIFRIRPIAPGMVGR